MAGSKFLGGAPSNLSWQDKLGLFAAGLNQLSGESGAINTQQSLLGQREQQRQLQSLLGQALSPQAQPDATRGLIASDPTALGESGLPVLDMPAMQAPSAGASQSALMRLAQAPGGLDVAKKVRDLQSEEWTTDSTSGLQQNKRTGEVREIPGYAQAAAGVAGSTKRAQESASADFSLPVLATSGGGTFQGLTTNQIIANLPDLIKQGIGVGQGTADRVAATAKAELPFIQPKAFAQARGAAEGASPFDFITVQGSDGQPVAMAKSRAAGGVFTGQSAAGREAATAGAKVRAESIAEGVNALPAVVGNAQDTIGLIDQLSKMPEINTRTGKMSVLPSLPGTGGANFDTLLDQVKGKTFLNAYSALRGAGAITENEGKAATAAYARLNRSQTPEAFRQALGDLRSSLAKGVERASARAQTPQPAASGKGFGGYAPTAYQEAARRALGR